MTSRRTPGLAGRRFQYGDHICAVHSTVEEQEAVAAAFVAEGLRGGERCLYAAASEAALTRFRERLRAQGTDAAAHERRRALLLLTKEQAHLVDGVFDSERMLRMLNRLLEDTLDDGFQGLRTCGDMTWLLDEAPGSMQVVEYEALVTQLLKGVRAIGMCQYDRARLPSEILDRALATHGTVVIEGAHVPNPFEEPAGLAATRPGRAADAKLKLSELGVHAAAARAQA